MDKNISLYLRRPKATAADNIKSVTIKGEKTNNSPHGAFTKFCCPLIFLFRETEKLKILQKIGIFSKIFRAIFFSWSEGVIITQKIEELIWTRPQMNGPKSCKKVIVYTVFY